MLGRDTSRVLKARAAFSTRRVPFQDLDLALIQGRAPMAGDVVLARVDALGSHKMIELPTGRKAQLFISDEIILAYGNRYAPDQYEAVVPPDLNACHMVAAGGIAGIAQGWHDKMSAPTAITPLGLIGASHADGGHHPINLADYALPTQKLFGQMALPPAFAVFGTSMNSGKTSTAAAIVRGLTACGLKVGALKITGTAAGGDPWLMLDSGAAEVLDFTDSGFPTTFGVEIRDILKSTDNLMATLAGRGCEAIVIEVADGLFQPETSRIATNRDFMLKLAGTIFAAGDAMGAVQGTDRLRQLGHKVLALSGSMTRSPLAIKEARDASGLNVLTLAELARPETAAIFRRQVRTVQDTAA